MREDSVNVKGSFWAKTITIMQQLAPLFSQSIVVGQLFTGRNGPWRTQDSFDVL
jgi:hypothetical protein